MKKIIAVASIIILGILALIPMVSVSAQSNNGYGWYCVNRAEYVINLTPFASPFDCPSETYPIYIDQDGAHIPTFIFLPTIIH